MSPRRFLSRFLSGAALVLGGTMFAASAGAADMTMNWFGGTAYQGEPALEATAALVAAGGGPENFEFSKALVSMLGEDTVKAEVAKLTKQYGEKNVGDFVNGMTYAVHTALAIATEAGVKLPAAPANLKGTELARTLVQAGTVDGTFWSGYLFDKALSHKIHNQVMAKIEATHGREYDENVHRVLNQAMYDVAQALGMKDVGLASLH